MAVRQISASLFRTGNPSRLGRWEEWQGAGHERSHPLAAEGPTPALQERSLFSASGAQEENWVQ